MSGEQILVLAARFDFTDQAVASLSKALGIALNRELNILNVGSSEFVDDRERRGQRELEAALRALIAAKKNLAKVLASLEDLRFKNKFAHAGVERPDYRHLAALKHAQTAIDSAKGFLEFAERYRLAIHTGTPDKRRARDIRREIVCFGIFNAWIDAGRKLTFTTDPITSERSGALVEFVNAVVIYITEPPSTLSGESIRTEIDRFKSLSVDPD